MKKQYERLTREIREGRAFATNIPNVLAQNEIYEKLANKKGFTAITTRNDNPSEILKTPMKADNRNIIKISTHYVILGNHKYTEEEIAEFADKTPRYAHEQIMKNINYYENGNTMFMAYYNNNVHFKSVVEYVDLNTNEIFTKQEMVEMGYMSNRPSGNKQPYLRVGIDKIVGI
jgi:calcineurin-like phosphoesterase